MNQISVETGPAATRLVAATTSPVRERILLFGGPGVGKTYAALCLARSMPTHFYILDCDLGIQRSLQEFSDLMGTDQLSIYPVVDWPDYRAAQKEICQKAQAGDWIVLDMAERAWSAVTRDFTGQIYNEEMGDYFMEKRAALKAGAKSLKAFEGWLDWPVINRRYEDFMFPIAYRSQAHLLITTGAATLSKDEEDATIRELYGTYGIKPAGQKSLPHQVDTALWLTNRGGWAMTTIKDRGRAYFDHEPVVDFPLQYGEIAKWGS